MTVIIRLQNLPWSANALDVRRYFQGLVIPDGGVHIVGGEKGDAFIAFATDEDARQAMYMDNGRICDAPVKLLLSSKSEMQNVIALARGAASATSGAAPAKSSGGHPLAPQGGIGISERGLANLPGSRSVSSDRIGASSMELGPRDGGNRMFEQRGPESRVGSFGMESRMGGSGSGAPQRPMPGVSRMDGGPQGIGGGAGTRIASERIGGSFDRLREEPTTRMQVGDRGRPGPGRMTGPEAGGQGWRREGPTRMETEPSPVTDRHEHHRMDQYERHSSVEDRPARGPPSFGEERRGYAPPTQDRGRYPSQERREHAPPPNYDNDSYNDYDDHTHHEERFREERPRGNFGGARHRENSSVERPRENFGERPRENFGERPRENFDERPRENFGERPRENFGGPRPRQGLMGDKPREGLMGDKPREGLMGDRPRENFADERQERYPERRPVERSVEPRRPREYGRREEQDWDRGPTWEAEYDDDSNDYQDNGHHREVYESDAGDYRQGYDDYEDQDYGEESYDKGAYNQGTGYEDDYAQEYAEEQMDQEPYYRENQFERNDGFPQRGRFTRGRGMRGDRGRGRGRGEFRGRGRGFGRGGFNDRPRFDTRRQDRDCFVFISNMPDTVSYKDVRRFFVGCEIPMDGLKLINDKNGQRNGTAYVMFGKPPDCTAALHRDGQMMGDKRVRIDKCHQEDFDRAVDSYRPGSGPYHGDGHPRRFRSRSPVSRLQNDGSNCIKLTNVHFRATRLDLRQFLGNAKISANGGPHIELGSDGRPTGTAFIQMESAADFNSAIRHNEKFLMRRPVTITPITQKEFDKCTQGNSEPTVDTRRVEKSEDTLNNENSTIQGSQEEKKLFCIKMRGLPFSATATSIREFFEGLEIANRGITLITNRQGQAAGPAFVEFVTSMDCKKALEKNKQYMGKRYIEITPMTKKDMIEDVEMEKQKASTAPAPSVHAPLKGVPDIPGVSRPGCTITMSNLPFKVQLEDIMAFLEFCNPIQDSVRLRYSKDGTPTGDAMVAFRNSGDAQRALRECNRKMMMGRQVVLAMAP